MCPFHCVPYSYKVSFLLGQDQLSILILDGIQIYLDFVTDLDINRLGELGDGNYAFGFEADINYYILFGNPHHFTFDDLSFFDIPERGLIHFQKLFEFIGGIFFLHSLRQGPGGGRRRFFFGRFYSQLLWFLSLLWFCDSCLFHCNGGLFLSSRFPPHCSSFLGGCPGSLGLSFLLTSFLRSLGGFAPSRFGSRSVFWFFLLNH